MNSEWRALDQIERAAQEQPYCTCGKPTTPVSRDDRLWLECTSLSEPVRGWRAQLARTLSLGPHVRRPVVDWVTQAA